MAKSCVIAPKKGVKMFRSFKSSLGYNMAWNIYGIAISPEFQNDYKDSLSFDGEGIPTFESLLKNKYIKNYIGKEGQKIVYQNAFESKEDTIYNYEQCLNEAQQFNQQNEDFVAIVDYTEDGIRTTVLDRTEENEQRFTDQYGSFKINKELASQLESMGIDIEDLTDVEINAGRLGVTDLRTAKNLANDTVAIIRRANNIEGHNAISEEFSHLIIRAMSDNPLVQRALNLLTNNKKLVVSILGEKEYNELLEFYDYRDDIDEVIAEEALGQILESNILAQKMNGANSALFNRMLDSIRNQFKDKDATAIISVLNEVNNITSDIAKNVVNKITLTEHEISNLQRENIQFNKLSDEVKVMAETLKKAANNETKRWKILGNENNTALKTKINKLLAASSSTDTADLIQNLGSYALSAVEDLKYAHQLLIDLNTGTNSDLKIVCNKLRGIRSSLASYAPLIKSLNDIVNNTHSTDEYDDYGNPVMESNEDEAYETMITSQDAFGNVNEISLGELVDKLNTLSKKIANQYQQKALPAFAEFIRPILGDSVQTIMNDPNSKVPIETLLKVAEGDISLLDRWLDSLGDSSDIMLRTMDKLIKNAKDDARIEAIDIIKEIQILMKKAENAGIKNFEWMFEVDNTGKKTGNYISEYNYGQYEKDYQQMLDNLDEKYGKNASGDKAKEKIKEKKEWLKTYTKELKEEQSDGSIKVTRIPNERYKNSAFSSLSSTQRNLLDKFMKIKNKLDSNYPPNRVYANRAIQIRKDGVQRFFDSISSPSSILSNIKENLASAVLESEDDDQIFGSNVRKGLTDFEGKEFMVMPVLYTNKLKNTDELSTDIFKSLMCYAVAATDYKHLDNIIDQLEVGRQILHDREVKVTRSNSGLHEVVKGLGNTFINDIIHPSGTNIDKKLDDLMASQVYGKHLKDAGFTEIAGKKINNNKATSLLLKMTSLAQMGFHWLANITNVTTGIGMQNIEAAAGQYFNVKTLASADGAYTAMLKDFIPELGKRIQTSKLSLFDELFDVKQDFKSSIKNQSASAFKRFFGARLAYLGQECGDHWLYNRTAIAMCKKQHLYKDGKDMGSIWDNLKIIDVGEGIKKMILDDGFTDEHGKSITAKSFARKIAHVNQSLFGIYNEDDQNAAKQVIAGRLILQYRNWIKPQFNKRFMKGQKNLDTGEWEEGYYRTMGRLLIDLVKGKDALALNWSKLSDIEKANVKRGLFEIVQFAAVWCLASLIKWPDDKNRSWFIKFAEYLAKKSTHELGNLTPSLTMGNEMLATLKSPAACISAVNNTINFMWAAMYPPYWLDEKQSGPFEGHSTLYSRFWKLPIPGISNYKKMDRFLNDLDSSIQFYGKASY